MFRGWSTFRRWPESWESRRHGSIGGPCQAQLRRFPTTGSDGIHDSIQERSWTSIATLATPVTKVYPKMHEEAGLSQANCHYYRSQSEIQTFRRLFTLSHQTRQDQGSKNGPNLADRPALSAEIPLHSTQTRPQTRAFQALLNKTHGYTARTICLLCIYSTIIYPGNTHG